MTSAAPEQTRARYPDAARLRRARAACASTGSAMDRGQPRSSCFRPGRSCTRAAGSARSRTSPGTAPSSRSIRVATAARTGPGPERSTRGGSTPPTPSRCSTLRASAVPSSWRWCDLGESLILAAEHPDRVAALVEIAPALQVGDVVPEPVASPVRRGARHRRGMGQGEPPLLAPRLARLRRVLLRRDLHRAALHEADRGRASAGRSRPTPRRCS